MGHLDKLDEELKDKGLTVIAITRQDRSAVDKFIEETGAKHTIVCESGDSMRAYGSRSWPTTFLIDPGGRIVYRGSTVPDSTITETLESVKILPDFPKSLKAVRKAFDKEKFADARSAVTKLVEGGKLEGDDKAKAEQIGEWLTWYANSTLEGAAKSREAGDHYAAWRTYMDMATWYKKAAEGKRAGALAKEMLADKEAKAEIKAGDKFAKLKIKIADMSPKKSIKALAPMTGKKYRDTKAGKQAAELIKALEKARP